jgi:hypothetical protein
MISKRYFLMGTASAMVTPDVFSSSSPVRSSTVLAGASLPPLGEAPDLQAWRHYLQQDFELIEGGKRWNVSLDDICSLDGTTGAQPTEQFVLGFVSKDPGRISSGLHSLTHANGQTATLYLTQSGQGTQQAMRAEFNLLQRLA